MLNLWRRHKARCPHKLRKYKNCSCPIWVQGTLHGKWMKKSLGIRNWESAQRLVREWEAGTKEAVMSVNEACDKFYQDAEARGLGSAQLGKYRLLIKELKREFGDRIVSHISVEDLRDLRASWKLSGVSSSKKLERLKTFFRFCQDAGWIGNNPARLLKPPKIKQKPTLPFSDEDMEKILWACEVYPDRPRGRREQMKAFVLLLRHSGLRIGDAISLTADKVRDGKLLLYTAKSGTPVWLPLPPEVVKSLHRVANFGRFFWSGNGILKSAVADWQRSLKRLFALAGEKGHAHQFRHTFAVKLLQSGVSLEHVAILLGHSSPAITNRHYSPWVKSRQETLEREIKKAWE